MKAIELRCKCGEQLRVPPGTAGTQVRCPYCQAVLQVGEREIPTAEPSRPWPPPANSSGYAESAVLKSLYWGLVAIGMATAAYIYLVAFDSFSEDVLVQLTVAWFFPLVFGIYGLLSQRLIRSITEGRATTLADATRLAVQTIGMVALPAMFPFLVLKWRNSFLVSLAASLWWAVLLWLFFAAVFPKL